MIGKNSGYKEQLFVAGFLESQLEAETLRCCFISIFPGIPGNHLDKSADCNTYDKPACPVGLEELQV